MKSSTKGLIALLGFIAILAVVAIIIFTTGRPEEVSVTKFFDDVYAHNVDVGSVRVSNDETSFRLTTDNRKNYVAYAYNNYTDNYYIQRLDNYNRGIEIAKRLQNGLNEHAQDATKGISAEEAQTEWEAFVDKSAELYLTVTDSYTDWAKADRILYVLGNRYGVSIMDYIYPIGMLVVMVVFMIMIFRSMRGGGNVANDFGKSKANVQSALKVRFSDVAGAEEEKEELAEIVDFLKTPAKFTGVGAKIPKGVLLVGPPGTGKTLFAKAVAGEANVPFFSISGSDFVEMYVGVGASRVRDLFAQAKKNQPCIIFIDEIDAVGRHRGAGLGGGHDEREQTLNQLLVQMDGFEANEAIIVMAATNRADILDPALMRPGRFDRKITVNRPDVRGREEIFKVHARNKPLASDVNFKVLARMTSGFTGADIANLLNEAAILCARAGRMQISMQDMCEAVDKVTMGPAKRSRLVTEVDKRITAYHEGGHAIVAKTLENVSGLPVQEVTIIPRGEAGGFTLMRPDNDDQFYSVATLKANIAVFMGGRAAEEIVIKDVTQGASMDIKQATQIARSMVTELGMSSALGPVCYGGEQEVFLGMDYGTKHSYSESTAAKIDEEVRRIVEEGHKTATAILTEKRQALDTLVRVLFECETIYSEEFEMIMQGASAEEVIEVVKNRTYRHYGANGRGAAPTAEPPARA